MSFVCVESFSQLPPPPLLPSTQCLVHFFILSGFYLVEPKLGTNFGQNKRKQKEVLRGEDSQSREPELLIFRV